LRLAVDPQGALAIFAADDEAALGDTRKDQDAAGFPAKLAGRRGLVVKGVSSAWFVSASISAADLADTGSAPIAIKKLRVMAPIRTCRKRVILVSLEELSRRFLTQDLEKAIDAPAVTADHGGNLRTAGDRQADSFHHDIDDFPTVARPVQALLDRGVKVKCCVDPLNSQPNANLRLASEWRVGKPQP
jgi:hypothetical protein